MLFLGIFLLVPSFILLVVAIYAARIAYSDAWDRAARSLAQEFRLNWFGALRVYFLLALLRAVPITLAFITASMAVVGFSFGVSALTIEGVMALTGT